MASLRPKQPYAQNNSPSTTSLLTPSARTSPGSYGVQAAFAQTPRSVSGSSDISSDDRYVTGSGKTPIPQSISDKFSLSPNPHEWGANLSLEYKEADDYIHNPDPKRDRNTDQGGSVFTYRGITNLGCLSILVIGLVSLFAGYPIISHFTKNVQSTLGGFNLGGVNASGQLPAMTGNWGLIDLATPQDAYTKADYVNGKKWQLIFSDEFNDDGRTFYPGDDPYWEAADLHYWQTNNMEWYDPAAITTKGGNLEITLSKKETHGLHYQGGMMSTWNKFCFTGGLIETSVVLPGITNVLGLWPAVWAMGNLGRAGYGASLEGMWPYTYDSCDIGTVANQSMNGLPVAAVSGGDPGESHPGPMHSDGTYVGRSAPEIDIFEAQISSDLVGQVSQSGQWAPFNAAYEWFNETNMVIADSDITIFNTYKGGVFQQATSGVTNTNQQAYELAGGVFSTYGFQYKPGFDGAYISWISDGKIAWTLKQPGMAADTRVEIGPRPVPQEPMYIIANLGMSTNFGDVDLDHLTFPTTMKIDWIRVYQDPDAINYGCDPDDFPTEAYINTYLEAYTNPNLTTWRDDFHQPFPKNSFLGQC